MSELSAPLNVSQILLLSVSDNPSLVLSCAVPYSEGYRTVAAVDTVAVTIPVHLSAAVEEEAEEVVVVDMK